MTEYMDSIYKTIENEDDDDYDDDDYDDDDYDDDDYDDDDYDDDDYEEERLIRAQIMPHVEIKQQEEFAKFEYEQFLKNTKQPKTNEEKTAKQEYERFLNSTVKQVYKEKTIKQECGANQNTDKPQHGL